MTDEAQQLLPPIDHVTLHQLLAKHDPAQPLPADLVRRGWNALHQLAIVLRIEDQVRNGPANDTRATLKASLTSQVTHAEMACRLFADAVRELAREQ